MQLTMEQFRDAYSAMRRMEKMELPTLLAFKVIRNLKKARGQAEEFDGFMREIQIKYAKKDENGNLEPDSNGNIFIDPENTDKYIQDYKDFMDTPIEIEFLNFNEVEFSKLDSLSPQILELLGPVLILAE